MAEHKVFSGAPPWEPTAHDDGDPSIITAVAFYSVATTFWVVGGRCRIPVGGGAVFPDEVTIELRTAPLFTLVDLSTAPAASAVATIADGWCEARFASAVELAPGTAAWISLKGLVSEDVYLFVGVGTVGVPALQADDASDLYLAEAGTVLGVEQPRAAFRSPAGSGTTTLSQAWYGLDVIVDDTEPGGTIWDVSGLAAATSSAQATVTAVRPVQGLAAAVSAAVGQVTARRPVTGFAAGISSAFATVTGGIAATLPTGGALVALTPTRAMTALTPHRGMDAA